jgi:Asp-tRNA(Asn)/Glu-tRNA(Gln) amidotransferase A subunit family amidase
VSIERARRIGPELNCIVELYEERAMAQARAAEAEIAAGRWRGPLHGLPWGAKDLISSKGDLTTWGSKPFENQRFDHDATVVERLNAAGAILLAKLSSGAMARGDVWHGERTRNPWNPQQGTGGSSAGPGAATAAAIVSFSIGTETLGSIVSPARNCGLSGLRPTFGRVSRYGVMPLSWTQDKVGPMCRSAIDCALVFEAIQGIDGRDPTAVDRPFEFSASVDFSRLRFGYVRNEFEGGGRGGRGGGRRGGRRGGGERGGEQEQGAPMSDMNRAALDKLRELGAELVPISLPSGLPTGALQFGLWVEGAAVQEEITRNGRINEMIRSTRPNQFRGLRFVPAVEYLQAQRGKMLLMEAMARSMAEFDVYVSTSGSSGLTNMTGHPVITVPMGFAGGMPRGIVFVGHLYDDDRLCAVASAYQAATDWHARRPGIG